MTEPRVFIVEQSNAHKGRVVERLIQTIREWADANDFMVKLSDIIRTLDQNAAMWPALRCFSEQVPWRLGDVERKLEPEDWKDILTAAFEKEVRIVPAWGSDGVVALGVRTSKYGKKRMGEFLAWLRAEGDNFGIRWSAPARDKFREFCESTT